MSEAQEDSWLSTTLMVIAAFTLGRAVQINSGMLDSRAIVWLAMGLAFCTIAVVAARLRGGGERWGEMVVRYMLLAALCLQLLQLGLRQPALTPLPAATFYWFRMALTAVGFIAGWGLVGLPGLRSSWFALVLLVHAAIGFWILHTLPDPPVDVHMFQREAANALLHGRNPYEVHFPNMYGPDTPFYDPRLIRDGMLTFSFPYFPLSAVLVTPAQLIAGDIRYAHLVAVTAAGALISALRPGPIAGAAACLYLFTPRIFYILEMAWTDTLVVLGLAAAMFSACRFPRTLPYVYGLFLAIKQYLVFAVLVVFQLARAAGVEVRRLLVTGLLVAAAVTVPFFLWSPQAFIDSVVTLQLYQPFRGDSLSFPAFIAARGGPILPSGLAFVAAALGLVVALWLAPKTPSGTASALALVYYVFFASNKQAFANYYLFVIGAMCCAIAAARLERQTPRDARAALIT
jgi:hypothetical protein